MTHTSSHGFDDAEVAGDNGGGMPWKLIALLLVAALLVVFFVQNGSKAPVEFLFWSGRWPVWAVIGVSVLFGVVLDRLASFALRRRH